MADVAMVLSLEMRGGGGGAWMFETGPDNGWVIDALQRADPHPLVNSVSLEIYQRMPNDTDFTPFRDAGRAGLNFAGVGRPHVYHQAYDTPGNLSESTLQHHGARTLALLQHFGTRDLASVHSPDVAYFSVSHLGLFAYGHAWIWGLGISVAALWALVLMVARRRGATLVRLLATCLLSVTYLVALGFAARGLVAWRSDAHWEVGALQAGTFFGEGWYVAALVALSVALLSAGFGVFRRWFTVLELGAGALLVPALLAILATVVAPMAAQNLHWPVLAGCLGVLAVAGTPKLGRLATGRWLAALVASVPVLAVLVPLTEGVWLAMGLQAAWPVAAVIGVQLLLVLPALGGLGTPNGWWAPAVGLAAAGGFLLMGSRAAAPSPDRPAPSTLVYALERGSGAAFWGTDAMRGASDPGFLWASRTLGPFQAGSADTGAGNGGETGEGGSVAVPGAIALHGGGVDGLVDFSTARVRYALAPATVADIAPLEVSVIPDGGSAGIGFSGRPLRVMVSSSIGAEMMLFRFGAGLELTAVDGRPMPGGGTARERTLEHWGSMGDGVALDILADPQQVSTVEFVVVEHHLRPVDLVGSDPFARPPELAPNVAMLSDRAMVRSRVSVNVACASARIVGGSDSGTEGMTRPDSLPCGDRPVAESASGEASDRVSAGVEADTTDPDSLVADTLAPIAAAAVLVRADARPWESAPDLDTHIVQWAGVPDPGFAMDSWSPTPVVVRVDAPGRSGVSGLVEMAGARAWGSVQERAHRGAGAS